MQNKLPALLLFSFIYLIAAPLNAAHIVGGETTYKYISHNADSTKVTFEIKFTLFRDDNPIGADFDSAATTKFGVHRRLANGSWELYSVINNVGPTGIEDLINPSYYCLANDPDENMKIEKGHYIFQVELEISDKDYMISFQRCCRSSLISNIVDPGDTGFAWDVIITPEAQRIGNSSPQFSTDPIVYLCSENTFELGILATDVDGDVLRYKLCSPKVAGGTFDATGTIDGNIGCCDCVRPDPSNCPPPFLTINYNPAYSVQDPTNSSLNYSSDGILSGIAPPSGLYVIGFCVEEYRNGVLLSQVRRDYALPFLMCDIDQSLAETFYADADGDSYGDPDTSVSGCELPEGFVENELDCDDTNPDINPDAEDEAGDGIDMNCDGADWVLSSVQDGDPTVLTLYPNPSSTSIRIAGLTNYEYEILSIEGKGIQSGKCLGQAIDIQQLKSGLYFIKTEGSLLRFMKI